MPTTTLVEVTKTNAPAVLMEIGYHDNPQDADWIRSNIDAIAKRWYVLLQNISACLLTAMSSQNGPAG